VHIAASQIAFRALEKTFLGFKMAWRQLQIWMNTGGADCTVWDWGRTLPDQFTFSWNTEHVSSATTLVSVWNTRVFRTALMALTEPCTLQQRITCLLSSRQRVLLHTYLHSYEPGIRTIRMTPVLHSSQGLQLCCSRLHNAWRCLCLSSADSHILHSHLYLALSFCHLLQ